MRLEYLLLREPCDELRMNKKPWKEEAAEYFRYLSMIIDFRE